MLERIPPDQLGPLVRVAIRRIQKRQTEAAPDVATMKPAAAQVTGTPLLGHAHPRIAPPMPEADLSAFHEACRLLGIVPLPWQDVAAHYLEARDPDGRRTFRDVVLLVARQNGKTEQIKPYIVRCLKAGLSVLHIAQNRDLPRDMFGAVAEGLSDSPELFPTRRGRTIWPRHGSGQEEIKLRNGGVYRIAASNRGGARGRSVDVLIIDETRELVDDDVMAAAKPTQTAADDPVTIYLSNAGDDDSVVLNGLRERARSGEDPRLAWLEWSAAPERAADDREGWAEANPSLGHFPNMLNELEAAYLASRLEGKTAHFETEHLCRWVPTMRESLVPADLWERCADAALPEPQRPVMAVSMDPDGRRASAAVAWRQPDGSIALRLELEATGDPIDTDKLGAYLRDRAKVLHVTETGFDPMTDAALARYLPRVESVVGTKYANACARFVSAVESGTLRWADAEAVTGDLLYTARKENDERGSFEAIRGKDDRPITAALAAIRAVWLASKPPVRHRITGGF